MAKRFFTVGVSMETARYEAQQMANEKRESVNLYKFHRGGFAAKTSDEPKLRRGVFLMSFEPEPDQNLSTALEQLGKAKKILAKLVKAGKSRGDEDARPILNSIQSLLNVVEMRIK